MWLVLALFGCGERIAFHDPIPDDGTFVRGEPTAEELARFEDAAAYSARHAGRALMILKGDVVVFEDYQNGYGPEEPNHIFSGTKSFACAMALAAREDGLLTLDERASDTLTEWQGVPDKEDVRIEQLMHFTSGMKSAFWRTTVDGLLVEQRIHDKYDLALGLPVETSPGETFDYNSTHLLVFGEVLARKTGKDPVEYLEERVLDPISFRYAGWNRDPSGNPMLAYGAWTTANEWAKFGVLVRDDGQWRGEEVLPRGAFDECLVGSAAMPAYGLNFWLNEIIDDDQVTKVPVVGLRGGQRVFPNAPADLFAAAGANDNRLYVVRSEDLVVVRLGDGSAMWRDADFLERLFGEGE